MNSQQPTLKQSVATVEPIPPRLDSSTSKLVYLYLWTSESATIDELHAVLGLEKLTLYPVLNTLIAADLVTQSEDSYRCQKRLPNETRA
ncbi:helix-turn-helix domain-containing protein [Halalkalicoccus sp. NIPERK01]|uniref:helix-turn-helix domain-containing protein n=1 Tax=Halalkalicoccus sp. NIPERK01 TaxID=3053469 RepID=UPI00256EF9A4|nr:helix-turn-helix domain-containing protein [Halalkalicoccus sp. NIPERK01]MDL5363177.1 helix-turn-helix domain-containing protein [Halalkalicoccus sp. NIPERK01]